MSVSHAQTFPTTHAFLRLELPQIMGPDEPDPPEAKSVEWMKYWLFRTSDLRFIPDPRLVDYVAEYKRCKRKQAVPWKDTKAFMEILFPTRYWIDDDVRYKQPVSAEQATRDELKYIAGVLEDQLEYRQSKKDPNGYCPIRFGLHMELFDELIRQVSLNCTMRAYMLERARGELYQTLDAYRKALDVSLVEECKTQIDPENTLLQEKMNEAQAELDKAITENANAKADCQELESQFELFDRIQKEVYEPEIEMTKKLKDALDRQLYHFENPPTFETIEEE